MYSKNYTHVNIYLKKWREKKSLLISFNHLRQGPSENSREGSRQTKKKQNCGHRKLQEKFLAQQAAQKTKTKKS